MELKQLQYFVACVDMGSMNRAADALYVTQSYISKTVKSLEDELGIVLLDRTRSGVQITDAGQKVYEYAQKMLEAERRISDVRQEHGAHKFSLSAMRNYGLTHLLALFCQTEKRFVRYRQGSLEDVVHHVSHRQAELGFLLVSVYQQQGVQSLLARNKVEWAPLCFARPTVWVGAGNPYYEKPSIGWNDLRKLRLVQACEGEIAMLRHLGCGNLAETVQAAAIVSGELAMMQMLQYTDMASVQFQLHPASPLPGGLRPVALDGCGKAIQFGWIHRLDAPLSEPGEAFIRSLAANIHPL